MNDSGGSIVRQDKPMTVWLTDDRRRIMVRIGETERHLSVDRAIELAERLEEADGEGEAQNDELHQAAMLRRAVERCDSGEQ